MAAESTITITATVEGAGLLVSLRTEGEHADESINRRFYSIASLPPADIPSWWFWSPLLAEIARFLANADS